MIYSTHSSSYSYLSIWKCFMSQKFQELSQNLFAFLILPYTIVPPFHPLKNNTVLSLRFHFFHITKMQIKTFLE